MAKGAELQREVAEAPNNKNLLQTVDICFMTVLCNTCISLTMLDVIKSNSMALNYGQVEQTLKYMGRHVAIFGNPC